MEKFGSGRFKSKDSVLSKLTQFHHKAFTLIIDKFSEWSRDRIVIINFNVIRFDWFSYILFRSFNWSGNVFFWNFYNKNKIYLVFCRFLCFFLDSLLKILLSKEEYFQVPFFVQVWNQVNASQKDFSILIIKISMLFFHMQSNGQYGLYCCPFPPCNILHI